MGGSKNQLKNEIESAVLFTLQKDVNARQLPTIENWPAVCDFLVSRKLAGRFYRHAQTQDLLGLIPEAERESLRQFYHLTAIKNKVLFTELKRVWEGLESPLVNLVLLKGASLILRGVYLPGERYQNDLDFLVRGVEKPELRKQISGLNYHYVQHADQQDWSEENYVLEGSKGAGDVFTVFLEFHWTFRPINRSGGQILARDLWAGAEELRSDGRSYRIPSAELQFYQAGLHGSAHHPFDSGYFWVALMDLSALSEKLTLNPSAIIAFAESQGLAEHLGIMSYLLANKLGLLPELWEQLAGRNAQSRTLIEQTAQKIWQALLNPRPVSLSHIIYLFAPTEAKNKRKAILELAGLRKHGDAVSVDGVHLANPRPGFFYLLSHRVRALDWEFLKLVWQVAKFYRRVKVYFPWGG